MNPKLREAHLVGKFTSALSRPVLDLGHCASWGKSSVKPKEDTEKENGMGIDFSFHMEDQTPAYEEEDLRRMKGVLKESGLMCRRDTELDLLRYLRACSFDVGKAKAMHQTIVEWIQEIGAHTIKEQGDQHMIYIEEDLHQKGERGTLSLKIFSQPHLCHKP